MRSQPCLSVRNPLLGCCYVEPASQTMKNPECGPRCMAVKIQGIFLLATRGLMALQEKRTTYPDYRAGFRSALLAKA